MGEGDTLSVPEGLDDVLPEPLVVGLPLSVGETVGEVEPEPLDDGDEDEDALGVSVPDELSVPEGDKLVEPDRE